jgi:hypothetical protein
MNMENRSLFFSFTLLSEHAACWQDVAGWKGVVWLPQAAESKRQQNGYFNLRKISTNFKLLSEIKGN